MTLIKLHQAGNLTPGNLPASYIPLQKGEVEALPLKISEKREYQTQSSSDSIATQLPHPNATSHSLVVAPLNTACEDQTRVAGQTLEAP